MEFLFEASGCRGKDDWWGKLWNLRVAPKFCLFLWRASHGILPCLAALVFRKVVSDDLCPLCGKENEYVTHALWSCNCSRQVWKYASFWPSISGLKPPNFKDFLISCFSILTP